MRHRSMVSPRSVNTFGSSPLIALLVTVVLLLPGCAGVTKQLNSPDDAERQQGLARLADASDSQKRAALPRLVALVGSDNTELRQQAWRTLEALHYSDGSLALTEVLADTQLAPSLFASLRDYWTRYPKAAREHLLILLIENDAEASGPWLWKRLRDPQVQFDADSAYYAWLKQQTSPVDTMRMLDTLARDAHNASKATLIAELVFARKLSEQHVTRLLAVMENDQLDDGARLEFSRRILADIQLSPEQLKQLLLSRKVLPAIRIVLVNDFQEADPSRGPDFFTIAYGILEDHTQPRDLRIHISQTFVQHDIERVGPVWAKCATDTAESEAMRKLFFELLTQYVRYDHPDMVRDVARINLADPALGDAWRLELLDMLAPKYDKALETACVAVCMQDAGSALCERAAEILTTHKSKRQKHIEAARQALALKAASSLDDFVRLYTAIPADVFLLMPLDVRLYANAVYELAIADHIIQGEVDPSDLATFSESAAKAVDCLSRAMEALKANQPDPEDCTGVSDTFKQQSDALMLKFAAVRDEAVHHVSLAAALTIKVDDPKLQARVQDVFLNAEQLKAAFFIAIWFKSARRQIIDIIAENPNAFETVDKAEPLPQSGENAIEQATP